MKTVRGVIPELEEIAKELGLKVNDGRVLQEYYKRQGK